MKSIFWALIILIFYCYFGYPLLLFLFAKLFSRPVRKSNFEPSISICMSVCDEEDVIENRIRNILSLDYPPEKLEIIIGSDGSVDKTNEMIRNCRDSRVRLFESQARRGKMATLNEIVRHAKNEIVVFADARQTFAQNAIHELTGNFADVKVGCASGELIFKKGEGATAKGVNLYWEYEKFLRKHESEIHSMIGATGAIYAIRRELYIPPPANTVLDDVFIPLKIVEKGFRAIFDEKAEAYDAAADSPKEEYRRKARTLYGNYQIFFSLPWIFNPLKSPIALQVFSHKFLRVMIPFFLIIIFLMNIFWLSEKVFSTIFLLQVVFYGMAFVGALLRYNEKGFLKVMSKVCYIPYVFCLLNFSALAGFFRFLGAKQDITWEKARKK